ncbi:MAG: Gfo/Idh/MocA family oxidoreductase, partial [Kiritimatiellia bacterium]|nr:Gfo/Idh/MocA family oxidoreductase [Kiritimatiellia bacterium]
PDEGGVLRDLIHEIDYACWLFGWPEALQAKVQTTRQLGIESEDTADIFWITGCGTVISIRLDYLSRPDRRFMRVCGEHGTLEWDGIVGTVKLELAGKPARMRKSSQTRDAMILAQDMAFISAVNGKADPCLATGEDGVRALAICDAAREASRLRREVKVNYGK